MNDHDDHRSEKNRSTDGYSISEPVVHVFRAFVVAVTVAVFALASSNTAPAAVRGNGDTNTIAQATLGADQ